MLFRCLSYKHPFTLLLYILTINAFIILLLICQYFDYFHFLLFEKHRNAVEIYDYVIVGGGSAGSLIASRLAQADKRRRIALLEAGGARWRFFDIPALSLLLQQSNFDWQYVTERQDGACQALHEQKSKWPRGKIMGGTSMLNNLLYVRGHPEDYRQWFPLADYQFERDILPYFKKVEEFLPPSNLSYSVFGDEVLQAGRQMGFDVLNGNVNCQIGFNEPKVHLNHGQRWTSSHRLLANGVPANLDIITHAHATKINFAGDFEAKFVSYLRYGRFYRAHARRAVIISAGVVESAKLLMLSGIGPKRHLASVGIRPKIDLPVGENLQDHVTTGFDLIRVNRSLDIGLSRMFAPGTIWQYFRWGAGPWTTLGCETVAYFKVKDDSREKKFRNFENIETDKIEVSAAVAPPRPDLQFMVLPLGVNEDNGVHIRHLHGISDAFWPHFRATSKIESVVTILPVLLHPKSRGTVRLRSKNPFSSPVINPQYLRHPDDVATLVAGLKLVKQLAETPHMRRIGAALDSAPFPGCQWAEFASTEYWECYVRHLTQTAYHPAGTCKMAPEIEGGVVGFDLRVHRTDKLFVADASVLPSLVSGPINGAVLMIGQMAVEKVLLYDYLARGRCFVVEIFLKSYICSCF